MNSERWHRRARATGDLLYGVHPIMEALDAGREIERITVQDGLRAEGLAELIAVARQRGIPVKKVPSEWFLRLGQRNHQGVVAAISPIVYQRIEGLLPMIYEWGEDPLLVLLDGVTDVRNLGAIARTAECVGAHGLIVPTTGSASINADTVKTSAGALLHLPVCRVPNTVQTVEYLRNSGLRVVAATEKGGVYYHNADLHGPVCLVLGDEEQGIDDRILRLADAEIRIPLHGRVQSLNVSVAAGVILYEMERQRGAARR